MNRMTELVVGDWILMQWVSGVHDQEIIHPDDLEIFKSELPYSGLAPSISLFLITGISGDYFEITGSDRGYRVLHNSSVLKKVPYSGRFRVGDRVEVEKTGKNKVVFGISWHFQKNEPLFTLSDGLKVERRRYLEADIRKISTEQ